MTQAFNVLSVPGGGSAANKVLSVYSVDPKVGTLVLAFLNKTEAALTSAQPGAELNFNVYESDDLNTWGDELNSALIVLKPGAQKVTTIISSKKYLKVEGYGTAAGGTVAFTIGFEGRAFAGGDVNIEVYGKSGFSADGLYTQPAASPWPQY